MNIMENPEINRINNANYVKIRDDRNIDHQLTARSESIVKFKLVDLIKTVLL